MVKHVETYYAIRIGDPRRRPAYFWVGLDGRVPVLFPTRAEAETQLESFSEISEVRVVRVKIHGG